MIEIVVQTTEEQVTLTVQDVPPIPLPTPDKPFWDFKSSLNGSLATAFNIPGNGTGVKLPNNAAIDTYFFGDKTQLYDPVTQRFITAEANRFYLIAVSLKAQTNANNTWVECYLRESTGLFSKRPQSEFIVRGANVENDMHFLLEYYASPSILATGFEVYVAANNAVQVWDIDYTVKML